MQRKVKYDSALWQKSIEIEKKFGKLRQQRRHSEAIKVGKKLLMIQEKIYSSNALELTDILRALALEFMNTKSKKDIKKAEPLIKRTIAIEEK